MRPLAAVLLAAAVVAAASSLAQPAAAQPTPPTPATVEADSPAGVVARFHAALDAGDAAGAAAPLADEAVIYEEGHVERSKAEYVAGHLPSDIKFSQAVPSAVTARTALATDAVAYVVSETTTKGSYNGRAIDRIGLETMVLRRGPQGWRIVHIHWSSRAAPATP